MKKFTTSARTAHVPGPFPSVLKVSAARTALSTTSGLRYRCGRSVEKVFVHRSSHAGKSLSLPPHRRPEPRQQPPRPALLLGLPHPIGGLPHPLKLLLRLHEGTRMHVHHE